MSDWQQRAAAVDQILAAAAEWSAGRSPGWDLRDAIAAALKQAAADAEQRVVRRIEELAADLYRAAIGSDGITAVVYRQNADRMRAALAEVTTTPQSTDVNGCPAQPHHGVDCPGDACRFTTTPQDAT